MRATSMTNVLRMPSAFEANALAIVTQDSRDREARVKRRSRPRRLLELQVGP